MILSAPFLIRFLPTSVRFKLEAGRGAAFDTTRTTNINVQIINVNLAKSADFDLSDFGLVLQIFTKKSLADRARAVTVAVLPLPLLRVCVRARARVGG